MPENFNPYSLHGTYFAATILSSPVSGRISVNRRGHIYLCNDEVGLAAGQRCACQDFFGHRLAWFIGNGITPAHYGVYDLRTLQRTNTSSWKSQQSGSSCEGPETEVYDSSEIVPNPIDCEERPKLFGWLKNPGK